MKEHLNKLIASAKAFWDSRTSTQKKLIGFGGGGAFALIVAVTVFLNFSSNGYKVLYPGLSSQETAEVYATLQELEVTPQINAKGEVMVPQDRWDALLVELAGKGYPQSVPTYGTFLDNASMTSTEYEKKKAYVFSLQDRVQVSLKRISGIKDAVVTINIPEESGYVWDKNTGSASAGIVITMERGNTLDPATVSSIKNLVAYSLPGMMKPENVKVIDTATGLEMSGEDAAQTQSGADYKRLEYERAIQKSIEDDIRRLLAPRYGAQGVTVVAKVTVNYDKIVTESREVVPQEDGKGVTGYYREDYTVDGSVPVEGIVGEENNTDVPNYQNQTQNGTGQMTNYSREIEYDIGYILEQVEKGTGVITNASVAVVVNDPDFNVDRQNTLIDLISKAVSIEPAYIQVTNLDYTEAVTPTGGNILDDILGNPMLPLIAGGILLLVVLLVILFIFLGRRSKRKKAEKEAALLAAQAAAAESDNPEQSLENLQQEIEEHKRMLRENAGNISKEDAIVEEIRDFAKTNPEITASILRTMLKEEE